MSVLLLFVVVVVFVVFVMVNGVIFDGKYEFEVPELLLQLCANLHVVLLECHFCWE
jgi:hypothetical protein